MPTLSELLDARDPFLAQETGTRFLGLPDRWLDDPHWRCLNDHVSRMFLKSEATGTDLCLACGAPVVLTFPEDVDGPLGPGGRR